MLKRRKNFRPEINTNNNKKKWRKESDIFRHIFCYSKLIERAINRNEDFKRAFLGDLYSDEEFTFDRVYMDSAKKTQIHNSKCVSHHEKVDNLNRSSIFTLADNIFKYALNSGDDLNEPLDEPNSM